MPDTVADHENYFFLENIGREWLKGLPLLSRQGGLGSVLIFVNNFLAFYTLFIRFVLMKLFRSTLALKRRDDG